MSLDSLSGGGLPANIAAMIADELASLAADARTLGAQLVTGDVVPAVVLRSNGLTDLLEIRGLRVAAALPATVIPGDAISVLVTGFGDDRIHLQIVPSPAPANLTADAPAARTPEPRGPAPEPPAVAAANLVQRGRAPRAGDQGMVSSEPVVANRRAVVTVPGALKGIEARIAAAYATNAPPLRSSAAPANGTRPPGRPTPAGRPVIGLRPAAGGPIVSTPAQSSALRVTLRRPAEYADPAGLLRGLRIALTPSNIASARTALEAPQRLPTALATLDRELATVADPRLATLRTLTGFLTRLEPQSPLLATQLAAFVDHVVTGREAKLAGLLALPVARVDEHAEPPTPERGGVQAETRPAPAATARVAASAELPGVAAGRAAALAVNLDYDLKTQLLAAAVAPDAGAAKSAPLAAALTTVLTAITVLQLNAAAAVDTPPAGLAFVVPLALPDGFAQARVRIDRDGPDAKTSLDGDNFHIAFILETRHLGTIAIDLATVGRAVTVSVKTEADPARLQFGSAMGKLTQRLEQLSYRVAAAQAAVAAPPVREPVRQPEPEIDPRRLVDVDA